MLKNMLIILYLIIGLLGFMGNDVLSILFIFIGFFGFGYFGTEKMIDINDKLC